MIDRWLTLYLVAPFRRVLYHQESRLRVPILMYHAITDDAEPGVRAYFRLNTPPALFRDHMQILKDEGFRVVDLHTAISLLNSGRSLAKANGTKGRRPSSLRSEPPRIAVITFDDGFNDFLTAAWPVLQRCGFPGSVFLPTNFIGRERRSFKGRPCLNWFEVRQLCLAGVSFGSHTVNHPKLWKLDHSTLQHELRDSRKAIEDKLGKRVDTFAHPYAFPSIDSAYVVRLREALGQSGYSFGVTTSLGCVREGDDQLTLKRLPVNGADSPALFRAKVLGAYDWFRRPQLVNKRLKRMIGVE